MTGLPALLGALGAVAFGFGLLSGLLAIFQPVPSWFWVFVNLGVGFILLAAACVSGFETLQERMASGEGKRVGRYGSSALFGTALTIAIICMLAFLSTRYSKRFDLTDSKVNSFSEQTLGLLERLDQNVQVTAFFDAAESPPIRDLLDRYAYESDRIALEFADPNRRPDLVQAFGIEPEALARGLVRIAIGESHVDLNEFSESEITNAILKLSQGEGRKIYFLESHDERPIEGERGRAGHGYSLAVESLRNENYDVESLLLASEGSVPSDADLVVIAGPTQPFHDVELAALDEFVSGGGALMALLDPLTESNIVDQLSTWGIEVGNDVVLDARLGLNGQLAMPFSSNYAPHSITEKLRERMLFRLVGSVAVAENSPEFKSIVFTSEDSWAETDLAGLARSGIPTFDSGDVLGPVSVGVAGQRSLGLEHSETLNDETDGARLVVFGDSDFASNELVGYVGNRDLFVNAVNWLVDDTDQIAIRPPVSRASRIRMTGKTFLRVQLLSLFVIPELIAVTGVFAWWTRRKRSVS